MRFLMMAAALMLAAPAMADYAQELPDFGTMRDRARTLEDVVAVRVVETNEQRGVIASYRSIYAAINPRGLSPAGIREMNTTGQLIFITDLDHSIVTYNCFIFHRPYGERHLLFAWSDGVATVELDGRRLRLRRYTVKATGIK